MGWRDGQRREIIDQRRKPWVRLRTSTQLTRIAEVGATASDALDRLPCVALGARSGRSQCRGHGNEAQGKTAENGPDQQ